jgi:hypothetical protein
MRNDAATPGQLKFPQPLLKPNFGIGPPVDISVLIYSQVLPNADQCLHFNAEVEAVLLLLLAM